MAASASAGSGSDKPRIQRLEETVVNRIAAGEVIQRPANAVKELLENSLDAGSTAITVTVKDGGLKLLQIQDNGSGIHRDDLDIVCERFTTSKLRSFEDLDSIGTYGFRGEALASISHVAHLTIVSRTADSACAYRAKYSDGKLVPEKPGLPSHPKPHAGTVGTQIIAEDLFYNVPARRRALKNGADQLNKIADVVSRYAVHNAGVSLTLKKAGDPSPVVRTSSSGSTVDNVRAVYGSAIAKELLKVEHVDKELGFKLTGYITNANYNMKRATQLLFINHRSVQSSNIKKALDEAYLPKNTHCFAYLSLEIAPEKVDVNVHPTKSEVHLMNEDDVVSKIQQVVGERLLGSNASRTFYTQALLPGVAASVEARQAATAANSAEDGESEESLTGPQSSRRVSSGSGRTVPVRTPSGPSAASQRTSRSRTGDEGPRIYDHDLVRTDARSQTLDKFLHRTTADEAREQMLASAPPLTAKRQQSVSAADATAAAGAVAAVQDDDDSDDWDPIRMRPKRAKPAPATSAPAAAAKDIAVASMDESEEGDVHVEIVADDESGEVDGTAANAEASVAAASGSRVASGSASASGRRLASGGSTSSTRPAVGRPWPQSVVDLSSVLEMRDAILADQHSVFRTILRDHVFVGCVDQNLALIQHQQHLYIVKTRLLSQELFYQLVLRGFADFNAITLEPAVGIEGAVRMALDRPEAKWSEDDGTKEEIAAQAATFLVSRADMLSEYFAVKITEDGTLASIPALLEGYMPSFAGLPLFLLRLATEVDWESERECFDSLSREIGRFYCEPETDWAEAGAADGQEASEASDATAEERGDAAGSASQPQRSVLWTVEHVIFPALRQMFAPPRRLADQGAALKVADLKDLYKVFERC